MQSIWFSFGCLVALSGCTTALNTRFVAERAPPLNGVIYALPMAAFDVQAQVLVTSCAVDAAGVAILDYELTGGSIRNNFVPDPTETYSFDYSALNSPLKTTTATVALHPNGMLKSVNADVEDKSAQVLTSLGSTVLNLYKASTLSFVPTSVAAAKKCGAFIDDKLQARRDLLERQIPEAKAADESLEKDKAEADAIGVELELTNSKLAEAQKAKDEPAIAALAPKVASLKAKLSVALKKLEGRSAKLPALRAKVEVLAKALTVSLSRPGWTPRGTEPQVCETISALQGDFFKKLARAEGSATPFEVSAGAMFAIDVCAMPVLGSRMAPAATASSPAFGGIVYRMPASGTVWIRNSNRHDERVDSVGMTSLPQFGAKGLVWLENTAFDKNNVKVAFNEDGSMSELTFSAASRAERAAAAASDASGTVVDLMKLRADAIKGRAQAADEEQKKAQQKHLDAIDAQIALIQKRKDLEAARLPAKDGFDREREQLQKEIELEKLRQELAEIKRKATAP